MYRFPKNRFVTADLSDPKIVRDMVQPAAEEVSGYLNEHNIVGGTFPLARRSEGMLYDFHYTSVSADMEITAGNGYLPVDTDPNIFRITGSGEWVTVSDVSQSWDGANDQVWALAWLQYSIVPSGAVTIFSLSTSSFPKPRVQFALRINGAIIDSTVTGLEDISEASIKHYYPAVPLTKLASDFVSIDPETTKGCSSMCWHCRAIRIQTVMPVPQGTVTVELVARRVPPNDAVDVSGQTEDVCIFNRKLLAVQMKQGSTGSLTSGVSVDVEYPSQESSWATTTLVSDILDPLKDAINGVKGGNLMLYSLRREHLPSGGSLKEKEQVELTAGSTSSRVYPGYGSNGTVGAGNWEEVNDGAGTNLRIPGPFNYTTDPGFVILLGNIAYTKASGGAAETNRYGAFAVAGMYTSGTPFKSDSAEAQVNNPNLNSSLDQYDADTDVPLLEFYDFRTSPPTGGQVDYWRMITSFNGNAAGTVEWDRSNLILLHFRP